MTQATETAHPSQPPRHRPAAVRRLRLTDYRCYPQLDLDCDTRPVMLWGENGAGKTNIIEAISFFAPGKGLRSASSEAIARRTESEQSGQWAVFAELESRGEHYRLGTGHRDGHRRETRLDGDPVTQSALARLIPMIWLTPAQDRLFAGPRADRLRFFDRLVTASDPAQAEALNAYEKTRLRRQRLLDEGQPDPSWLRAIELEMAGQGVAIAAARLDALIRLQAEIDAHGDGAFPRADLALAGDVESDLSEGLSVSEAEDNFMAALEAGRIRDGAAGRTLTAGPHRTDLIAHHRGKRQIASDCSTGEQKALLLSLTLAQARVLGDLYGIAPILLFDEACAHLDARRRDGLAQEILATGSQAWLTGVERKLFEAFQSDAQYIEISDAQASPKTGSMPLS